MCVLFNFILWKMFQYNVWVLLARSYTQLYEINRLSEYCTRRLCVGSGPELEKVLDTIIISFKNNIYIYQKSLNCLGLHSAS
jgi:hypothetical protein